MRRSFPWLIALSFLGGLPTSASADVFQDCKQGEPDRRILACTQIITERRTKPAARAELHVHRGQAYMSKDDHDRALADATEAIRLDAKSAKAFNLRGTALQKKKEHDRAIADFSEAIRLDPGFALAYVNRGDAWDEKGELDRAIADLNEGIRLDPKSARAFNLRGYVQQRKREYDQAIADDSRAIDIDANFAPAYRHRARAFATKNDYDKAIADFARRYGSTGPCGSLRQSQRRLGRQGRSRPGHRRCQRRDRLDSKSARAQLAWVPPAEEARVRPGDRGLHEGDRDRPQDGLSVPRTRRGLLRKGEHERAIADLSEALRLDPKSANGYLARASAYQLKGDQQSALADYDEAIRIDRSVCACAYLGRGQNLRSERRVRSRRQRVHGGNQPRPENRTAYNNRGVIFAERQEYEKAIADFGKAIELDPTYAMSYNDRGLAHAGKKNYDRLRYARLSNEAIRAMPSRTPITIAGFIYSNSREEYDLAIADFEKAIEIIPSALGLPLPCRRTHRRKKNYDRAIADFNEAIRLDGKMAVSYLGRGNAYEEKGEYKTALADYDEAIRIDASICPCAYLSRGLLYWRIGDLDKSIVEYTQALKHDPKYSYSLQQQGPGARSQG